jgi:hypothetical protein
MKDILELAINFEKFAQQPVAAPMGGVKQSMQADDVEKALVATGLWGGSEGSFDQNSKAADKVFKILDKYAPPDGSFKIDTWINVTNSLNVTITAKATKNSAEISRDLTHVFGPAMSAVCKKLAMKLDPPPNPGLLIKWLNQVGY